MGDFEKMKEAALSAMTHVLNLKPEHTVLVVTDKATKRIGESFLEGVRGHGCRAEMYEILDEIRPLSEVPEALCPMLDGVNIVVNVFQGLSEETPFRVKWIKQVVAAKAKLAHAPGITEAMMTSGPMHVDYAAMADTAERLILSFDNATTVRITAPAGTDVTIDITDRPFRTDTRVTPDSPGCNLPCGEIFCAPVETAGNGKLVVDGSIGDIGNVTEPLKIEMRGGRITAIESKDENQAAEVRKLTTVDDEAAVIGELGIGVNPGARLTGNLLEDEKAFKTAHIAFGNNSEMPGGKNGSETHRDFLMRDPTIVVTYRDGSQGTPVKEGVLQV